MPFGRTVFVALGSDGEPAAVYTSRAEALRSTNPTTRVYQVPLWGPVAEIAKEQRRVVKEAGYSREVYRDSELRKE